MSAILGCLALLSLVLTLWQWLLARRFPLHRRAAGLPQGAGRAPSPSNQAALLPGVSLLKPLKGCEATTEDCLRSWFTQDYPGPIQLLFGVAAEDDPVCPVVRRLCAAYPSLNAQLVICGPPTGFNSKVSKLAVLEQLARQEAVVLSDADVLVPPDFLANVVPMLDEPKGSGPACGLVNCFYCLANPSTLAMRFEAIAINADFWSSVLQARSLKPLDFALGAVMATRRRYLAEIGGFSALVNHLADDYQLGHRIAARGHRIELSPLVVECWSEPMGWRAVWKHQLRWARTIRVCQPVPYFFSLLSNATLWPVLWLAVKPTLPVAGIAAACLAVRLLTAIHAQRRLSGAASHAWFFWLVPVKDLLQGLLWLLAFLGNTVEWRGQRLRLGRDGALVPGA